MMNCASPTSYWQNQTDDLPLYFLHIPKTAGTSLISVLDNQFMLPQICPAYALTELFQIPKEQLQVYRLFRGHFWYGLHEYINRKVKYITLLRHPVDRTISYFHYVSLDPGSYRHSTVLNEKWTLSDFVNDSETNWDIINTQTLFISVDYDFKELANEPVNYGRARVKEVLRSTVEEHLLRIAKQRLAEFAYVGITEKMTDSVNLLCYTFGWNPNVEVGRLRVTPSRLRQADIPKSTLEKIYELNRADMALYEYAQKLFTERYSRMVRELNSFHFVSLNTADCSIDFSFDEPFSGSGWYYQEGSSGVANSWRWTGPGTTSTVNFLLESDNRDLVLEFRVINWMSVDILESLKVRVNDHYIKIQRLEEMNGEIIFEGVIPWTLLPNRKGLVSLSFLVDRTISPNILDPENADQRTLGVAIGTIIISPETMLVLKSKRAEKFLFLQHWHDPESYRWSAQKVASFLVVKTLGDRVLTLEAFSAFPGQYLVEVLVNSQWIGEMEFQEPGARTFRFPIDEFPGGEFTVSLRVPFLWKPSEQLGTEDTRIVGIALKSVDLSRNR